MQNCKDVCSNYDEVWFEVEPLKHKKFFCWAKELGCVWINGSTINPCEKINFTHFAIDSKGKLSIVPISLWVSKADRTKSVEKRIFNPAKQQVIK